MPKVIDVFSGVGGLSLGAAKAGFNLVGAVELDSNAIYNHALNFPNSKHLQVDVAKISGKDLLQYFNLKKGELSGLIGGPPCQGFSPMGKQNVDDPRNKLFIHFFRLVKELNPEFFLAENVPGILHTKFDDIRNEAFDLIKDKYTILPPFSLNAKDYGAPTSRSRVFFIGFKKNRLNNLNCEVFFPEESKQKNFVGDAFKGLPSHVKVYSEQKTNELVWCKVEKPESNSYAELLSKHIPVGVGNEEAINRYVHFSEVSGMIGTKHTKEVQARYALIQPGEQDKISRSIRLKLDGLCPTLRAGTDRDRGSFQAVRPIHPTEGRVITPREAARLQGFPDWFVFHPTKWHSFRQIGNSVSPIIAEYILSKIIGRL